mmetsp:Transcript_76558/g.112149  ORF Transcript_76558/g.112149 Transcript_76558/m.112149 type:complete len:144 (-) Transcript_76558:92-523(-)
MCVYFESRLQGGGIQENKYYDHMAQMYRGRKVSISTCITKLNMAQVTLAWMRMYIVVPFLRDHSFFQTSFPSEVALLFSHSLSLTRFRSRAVSRSPFKHCACTHTVSLSISLSSFQICSLVLCLFALTTPHGTLQPTVTNAVP